MADDKTHFWKSFGKALGAEFREGELVGWVERSDTHHHLIDSSDGFRKGSTHPTNYELLGPVSFLGIRSRISTSASKAISQALSMNPSPRGVALIRFLMSD